MAKSLGYVCRLDELPLSTMQGLTIRLTPTSSLLNLTPTPPGDIDIGKEDDSNYGSATWLQEHSPAYHASLQASEPPLVGPASAAEGTNQPRTNPPGPTPLKPRVRLEGRGVGWWWTPTPRWWWTLWPSGCVWSATPWSTGL